MRALLRPQPQRGQGPLSYPILIAYPKKRKRIFFRSRGNRLAGVIRPARRGLPWFGATGAAPQDVLLLLHRIDNRKGQNRRKGQNGLSSRSALQGSPNAL